MKKVDVEALQATYRELYELVGEESMLKIFNILSWYAVGFSSAPV